MNEWLEQQTRDAQSGWALVVSKGGTGKKGQTQRWHTFKPTGTGALQGAVGEFLFRGTKPAPLA